MTTRWKTALAAAGGAAVAAVAVLALSGRASEDTSAAPPDSTPTTAPGATTEGATGDRTITVNGRGSVSVVPDIAELGAGVQSTADTASAALDTVGTRSQALVETLRGSGIADDDIQTSGLSLYPQFGDDGREITGYQASTNVNATIRDVTRVGEIVDALQGFVGNLHTFDASLPQGLYRRTRDLLAFADRHIARLDLALGALPDQAVAHRPLHRIAAQTDQVDRVEGPDDLVGSAQPKRAQEDARQELSLTVDADVEQILGVVLELDPRSPIGDDLRDVQGLVFGVEERAR